MNHVAGILDAGIVIEDILRL